jgi:hypothetical protein
MQCQEVHLHRHGETSLRNTVSAQAQFSPDLRQSTVRLGVVEYIAKGVHRGGLDGSPQIPPRKSGEFTVQIVDMMPPRPAQMYFMQEN